MSVRIRDVEIIRPDWDTIWLNIEGDVDFGMSNCVIKVRE